MPCMASHRHRPAGASASWPTTPLSRGYDADALFRVPSGPDFFVGPDADPGQRNILGMINKLGVRLGQRVLRHLGESHELVAMLGGRFVHPVMALPGGVAKAVTPEMQTRMIEIGESMVELAQFSLGLWRDMVLGSQGFHDMIMGDTYLHHTHSIGLVG